MSIISKDVSNRNIKISGVGQCVFSVRGSTSSSGRIFAPFGLTSGFGGHYLRVQLAATAASAGLFLPICSSSADPHTSLLGQARPVDFITSAGLIFAI